MENKILKSIKESIEAKELLKKDADTIAGIARTIINSVKKGGKVIIFGNGGSAADSQHIAAELMGRFKKERAPIPAIALTTNTSSLTAIGNDYGYDVTFSRQLEGIAKPEDVAIGISTSGNAKNVNRAIEKAGEMGLATIGLTGGSGGELAKNAKLVLKVPSDSTPRIQELHITTIHIICELVEEALS